MIEDEIEYCQQLVAVIEQDGRFTGLPKVSETLNLLKETVADDQEHLQTSADPECQSRSQKCGLLVFWIQNSYRDERRTNRYRSHGYNRRTA